MLDQSSTLKLATELLLDNAALSTQQLAEVLGRAMTPQIDYADLFLQSSCDEVWALEDHIIKKADYNLDRGFGLRVLGGEKTGFAYADDIALNALNQAARTAASIVKQGDNGLIRVGATVPALPLYPALNPLQLWQDSDKVALLHQVDQAARRADNRIEDVQVQLAASYEVVMVMTSEGVLAADIRPLVSLTVRVIAAEQGRREQGFAGGGGRDSYALFTQTGVVDRYVNKAVNQAITNLSAKPAPAGTLPVVLAAGWPAVLFHEAVGHGLEADFNRKGSSAFTGRLGEQVASPVCTLVDDGTLPNRRGSLAIDDEGSSAANTVLIENGVLQNYLQDKHNALLMQQAVTGNGRRESYAHLPLPRMTNTYLQPGTQDPQEIIASVAKGLYAVDFSGGQVDITSGSFVFSTSEAYLIENGKITHPVKGATLIGGGPEVLHRISMVGNDLQLDSGIGTCGKAGQSVPVGVGQPTVKIDSLTVGGSQV